MKRLLISTALALLMVGAAHAAVTTFNFGVVFDIQTQAQFNTVFGTGTTGFSNGGAYENLSPASTAAVVKVSGATASAAPPVLQTFIQNETPATQQELLFSHFGTNPSAIFPGAALSGSTWQYVQTISGGTAGFTYNLGGSATTFDLNSIGLANTQSCSCSTGVTIVGYLGGSLVATDAVSIPGNIVGGNGNPGVPASVQIFTLPGSFAKVDTVDILPGAGQVNVNDISISPVATSAIPEARTWVMMLLGFGVLATFGWHKRVAAL